MVRRLMFTLAALSALALILFGLCYFGIWIPNEPSREKYPVRGIDVSHHQGTINWNSVRNSGIHFAYIKATEGADFKDPEFSENWKNSAHAGLIRGAYHFFTLGTSGKFQAENFIATARAEPAALPPAIDLELSGYNTLHRAAPKDFQRELSIFWDAILTRYGKVPVVYTTSDFQKEYLALMPLERLWIREVIGTPRQPWTFWQFSPRGKISGVSTFVDVNVFNATLEELGKLVKARYN